MGDIINLDQKRKEKLDHKEKVIELMDRVEKVNTLMDALMAHSNRASAKEIKARKKRNEALLRKLRMKK